MHLITGDTLKNLESDAEAFYVAALPTIGKGALHVIQEGENYLFKFADELTSDYEHTYRGDTPVAPAGAATDITGAPTTGLDPAKLDELLALLRAQTNNATQAPADALPPTGQTQPTPATPASSPGVEVTGVPTPPATEQVDIPTTQYEEFLRWQASQVPDVPATEAPPISAPTPSQAPFSPPEPPPAQ